MNLQNVTSSEWFINQKRIPDRDSQEYELFFEFHKELCLNGFMMDGVYINPFLYWHLNMWRTEVDVIDNNGRIYQKYTNPTLRDNEWIITNEIDRAQKERKGLVILGIRRLGKALQNDELLYTPDGEIKIGNVKIGDSIYGADGKLTCVTGVFPQGKVPIYKMLLEDGRELFCCENHIWRVFDKRNKKSKGRIKDLSIKELLPIYKNKRVHNGYRDGVTRIVEECHFAIPNNTAVEYSEKSLLIDPYYLGLWLGDGSSRRPGITSIDNEIINYVYDYAKSLSLEVRTDKEEYIITSGKTGGRSDKNLIVNHLKHYNLILNKHIPFDYLTSSVEQRLELLKGLMDTDGSVYKNGTIDFTTTNERLAEDFYKLCRSLGINLSKTKFTPKLYGKACGEGWRFTLFTEIPIFKLKRKLDNYKIGNSGKQFKINYTSIRDISLVDEDYATCITVDNEDKLFLTTNFTTTHNSVIEASYIGWGATFDENSQNVIAGLNAPDIKLITDKLDKGLNFVPEYYRWQRVEDNWKNQVTLGIKTRAGERIPFSQILIRNLDEGNNEEAIAGTKPRKLIIDEALHEDSILYSISGTVSIKDVKIGDSIYGADGKLCKIVDKINPGVVDSYKITLLDGREVIASGNHLWKVWNVYTKKWNELTTDQLREKWYFEKRDERYSKTVKSYIYSIPVNSTIDYPEQVVELDPYWLGTWLGDGTSDNSQICSIDDEIIEYWKNYSDSLGLSFTISENIENKCVEFKRISIVGKKGKLNPIREKLRQYNIFKNKHIPKEYLYNSFENRLALLQGLIDTDGSVSIDNTIEFGTSIPKLADDFEFLCRSMGIVVFRKTVRKTYTHKGEKKLGKEHFRFTLYTNLNVSKLPRKLKNILNSENKKSKAYKNRITIKNIEPVGKNQVYCIKVDNSDNLFITENFIVTHNCGKGSFLRGLQAAIPGFTTPFGWGCSPILTGTGGDMKRFMDAKSLMFDVDNYNFLSYNTSEDTKRVHGLFISNKYRMEAKYPSTLGAYLEAPTNSDLYNLPIYVSDEEKAEAIVTENLERLKKAGDRSAYLKEKMYYPQKVDDIFLNEDTNIFDIEAARRQKTRLLQNERTGTPVVLHIDEGRVYHEFTDKQPITNFPLKPTDNKDAPVVIYEFPVESPPYGLYVAGVDSYRQGQAKYSTSLGSVYIYKRMHDITGEKYQDMFVASYCARPDKKEHWEEQARLLIKYYNARALCENDDMSFIEYMKSKGDSYYLEKQPNWLKEVIPNTTVAREFGVHRSAQKMINYLHSCLKAYMEEVIHIEKDDDGKITKEVMGVSKIFDPMLLEEIIQYNEEGNFDRIVAAELAIAQAIKMDPILGRIGASSDDRVKSLYSKKHKQQRLFSSSGGLFNTRKNKLFS